MRADFGRGLAVLDLELLAVLLREATEEWCLVSLDRHEAHAAVPVLFGLECLDLALSVHDETERDALHTTRGETEGQLRPDEGGDVVADETIELAACSIERAR